MLDSPKLLMLSGVGEERELADHNIPLVASVPGIGKNLQDHPFLIWLGQRKVLICQFRGRESSADLAL